MNGAMADLPDRTLTLVIGALGGEGGGVLTGWVVRAAELENFPVQSTSIPGVAQRTGATTYYVEIYPVSRDRLEGASPVMALYPAPGNMDLVVASELMEAGRAVELGMVTPDRTTLIASTHRFYSILERSAMGDGLFDGANLMQAADALAQRAILFDLNRLAQAHGSVLNAVVLGIIAGCGKLPIAEESYEQAIRDTGVAVDSNLRGFKAGLGYLKGEISLPPAPEADPESSRWARGVALGELLSRVETEFPPETHRTLKEGVRRLVDYQNRKYARTYLDRLAMVVDIDKARDGASQGFRLTIETGRHLALWMSFEDIIRVADLKSRPERLRKLREEVRADEDQPVVFTEYLKPGYEEIASILPPALGRRLMRWAGRKPSRLKFHFAMRVKSSAFFGFLRLWLLARMKWWRPFSYRFAEEQAEIGRWLDAIEATGVHDYTLSVETAELAGLRKGYSDTHKRGIASYKRIFESLVVPATTGAGDAAAAAIAVRKARKAALDDESGNSLTETLAEMGIRADTPSNHVPPSIPPSDEPRAAAE